MTDQNRNTDYQDEDDDPDEDDDVMSRTHWSGFDTWEEYWGLK